jgi:hypothetical protein
MRLGLVFSLSNAISIEKFLSPQIAIASGSDKYLLFSRLDKHHFKISMIFADISVNYDLKSFLSCF